jgi:thiamine-phosphate pyrophosphorylase
MAVTECRSAVPTSLEQRAVRAWNLICSYAPWRPYDVAVTALMGLDAKLRLARTLVIIDTRHDDIAAFVSALFAHGADMIQVRDPEASLDAVRTVVETAQRIAMPLNKLVAVTGDLEVARRVMADVLVGGADLDPGLAHGRLHEYALVGAPAFTADDCRQIAGSDAVEFALVGPVHLPSGAAATAPGLDLVRVAAETMPVADAKGTPWFAVGGITPDRLADVIAAGARRAGVAVTGENDLLDVGRVSSALRQAWADDPALQDFAFRALSTGSRAAGFRNLSGPTSW